jgi:hypothetical protein
LTGRSQKVTRIERSLDRNGGIRQLFSHCHLLRTSITSSSLPNQVLTHLSPSNFAEALDSLIISTLPFAASSASFQIAFLLFALSFTGVSQSLEAFPQANTQITSHFDHLISLLSSSSMKSEHDGQDSTYVREVLRIKEFLVLHKSQFHKRVVMRLIDESGEWQLLTREALVAFQDYQGLVGKTESRVNLRVERRKELKT